MVSLESTVDTGHEDMIHDAQLDYYGTRMATAASDRTVKVFEVRGGDAGAATQQAHTLVAELKGHEGPVWQVAWANPKYGNILASCSYDRKVRKAGRIGYRRTFFTVFFVYPSYQQHVY